MRETVTVHIGTSKPSSTATTPDSNLLEFASVDVAEQDAGQFPEFVDTEISGSSGLVFW